MKERRKRRARRAEKKRASQKAKAPKKKSPLDIVSEYLEKTRRPSVEIVGIFGHRRTTTCGPSAPRSYRVAPAQGGGWTIKEHGSNQSSGHFRTRSEAVEQAKVLASSARRRKETSQSH